ncbi:virulence factor TspB C-terminal domain-related protein [Hydrogenophaga sp.]|uniref:virulence factor TspB C-terminal domain-related protein n=1 Tax=Hydrogenophaga sp. TaxID=1904254 RepID=UPI0027354790|nr:virulence factor TspB C-terminal domain-related protein [Hydrogenophaga sp.]MDP3887125.1 virulence factor TspB C-terminal domain-related protein [Hydrogenophaga sp.]
MKVDSTNAIVSLGSSSMDGGNGTGHPIDSITELDVGVLNQANPWGAGCPADRVLTTFMGKAIVVPLSSACSTFQIMGNVLVGFALLAGAFIVVGRT